SFYLSVIARGRLQRLDISPWVSMLGDSPQKAVIDLPRTEIQRQQYPESGRTQAFGNRPQIECNHRQARSQCVIESVTPSFGPHGRQENDIGTLALEQMWRFDFAVATGDGDHSRLEQRLVVLRVADHHEFDREATRGGVPRAF